MTCVARRSHVRHEATARHAAEIAFTRARPLGYQNFWLPPGAGALPIGGLGGSTMLSGQCNCGAVAFKIHADVKDVYVCHCSICRKWTGTNGVAVVVVANEAVEWVRGRDQVRIWKKPGADWQSAFCDCCGSALPVANDDKRTAIPAGLLDDAAGDLRVAAHIWVGSKARWDVIGDGGHQYACAFGHDEAPAATHHPDQPTSS